MWYIKYQILKNIFSLFIYKFLLNLHVKCDEVYKRKLILFHFISSESEGQNNLQKIYNLLVLINSINILITCNV